MQLLSKREAADSVIESYARIKGFNKNLIIDAYREYLRGQPYRVGHNKGSRGFTALLELYAQGLTFSEIGEKLGCTRERARQIYNRYFKALFFDQTGTARAARRKTDMTDEVWRSSGTFADLVRACAELGLTVAPVRSCGQILRSTVQVNGHQCLIRNVHRHARPPLGKMVYARFAIWQEYPPEVEYVIFRVRVPGFPLSTYIAPVQIFRGLKAGRMMYIPLTQKQVRAGRPAEFDWTPYRGAWHLLQGESWQNDLRNS